MHCTQFGKTEKFEFTTLEELYALPFVASYKQHPAFDKFILDTDGTLLVKYKDTVRKNLVAHLYGEHQDLGIETLTQEQIMANKETS